MHNLLIMAVVDHIEYLLYDDCCIVLAHLSALQDLIEKLATFANFHDNEESFVILKELVHLHDVRVVLKSVQHRRGSFVEPRLTYNA